MAGLVIAAVPAAAASAAAVPIGSVRWSQQFTTSGMPYGARAAAAAVSSDGQTVFVTGSGVGSDGRERITTIAYRLADGGRAWTAMVDEAGRSDSAVSMAASKDGKTLFLAGTSMATSGSFASDMIVAAYDSRTGARRWLARYDGPSHRSDEATAMAITADGASVVVVGTTESASTGIDIATVAFAAASGARRWVRTTAGPGAAYDAPAGIVAGPLGIVVAGTLSGDGAADYVAVGLAPATGAQRWRRTYNGPAHGRDVADGVALSPDGATAYVTGGSETAAGPEDFTTIAYAVGAGTPKWTTRTDGGAGTTDIGLAAAASPDGAAVFVTGSTIEANGNMAYATAAYDARTGKMRWLRRYDDAGRSPFSTPVSAAALPGGGVAVAGTSVGATTDADFATLAYGPDGRVLWQRRFNGAANGADQAAAMVRSADGSTTVVTGSSADSNSVDSYATQAYVTG